MELILLSDELYKLVSVTEEMMAGVEILAGWIALISVTYYVYT